ncbi:hypothetical protein VTH06DRAFT_5052 [Thermothelomyces fergusii]
MRTVGPGLAFFDTKLAHWRYLRQKACRPPAGLLRWPAPQSSGQFAPFFGLLPDWAAFSRLFHRCPTRAPHTLHPEPNPNVAFFPVARGRKRKEKGKIYPWNYPSAPLLFRQSNPTQPHREVLHGSAPQSSAVQLALSHS